jgi:hypothetical protein
MKARQATAQRRQRDIYHRPGLGDNVVFELVDSKGVVVMECRVSPDLANQRTANWLRRVLDAVDPEAPPLKIVS